MLGTDSYRNPPPVQPLTSAMFRLMRERPSDGTEVEWLLDLAFAPGRTALSSYRLRDGVAPVAELCMVVRDEFDALAGCIRYWPIRIGDAGTPALLLGPVAVHPTRQGEGIGALLIRETLAIAADEDHERVVLVGDFPYYARFGFSHDPVREITYPPPYNPERLLGKELVPGAFRTCSGMVRPWNFPTSG